jgi:hypothetical protein
LTFVTGALGDPMSNGPNAQKLYVVFDLIGSAQDFKLPA